MGAVTARVTDSGGQVMSASATYAVGSRLRIGWSCPLDELASRYTMFPGTKFVRIFMGPGEGLPPWSAFSMLANDVQLQVSVKERGLNWPAWIASRPARFTVDTIGTIDHEPEQQDSGDPSPAEFWDEWRELCAQAGGIDKLILAPTFTRYAAEKGADRATWYQNFGRVVELDGIGAVGWDIYNYANDRYLTSAEMFDWCADFAEARNLDMFVSEWGRRRLSFDNGTQCAQRMHEDAAYARTRRIRGMSWFYKGSDNLDTAGTGGTPRLPERNALAKLIQEQR